MIRSGNSFDPLNNGFIAVYTLAAGEIADPAVNNMYRTFGFEILRAILSVRRRRQHMGDRCLYGAYGLAENLRNCYCKQYRFGCNPSRMQFGKVANGLILNFL
ncbi:uncharacterized protein LOC125499887 [Athalia rosae]|uniref:uncharacterized protein LOC125499887 n=1 Tax=Athalia rosae TaxID=37344 RepID=UPI002033B9B5|nr:uncharacterized protein LOC125499887 [Athalia rosae]